MQTNLSIPINHNSATPLGQQLYSHLYRMIVNGELAPGTQLPPTRQLADSLGVARATITDTYKQLKDEGYLEADGRSGTKVARFGGSDSATSAKTTKRVALPLSDFAQTVLTQPSFDPRVPEVKTPLYNWVMAEEELPMRLLQTRFNKILSEASRHITDYPRDPRGLEALREAIAQHLASHKTLQIDPAQIIITTGWQQALDLIVRMHVRPGARVIVEDPGYPTVNQMFLAAGATLIPIGVDADGMKTQEVESLAASIAYVTPSHQFPTGAVLAPHRRNSLLQWAARNGAIIIEEEHDSDFRYSGHPAPSLKSLDPHGNVIHQANFAKTIFPGLSLGYMIVPPGLSDAYRRAKLLLQEPPAILLQQAIADFISNGDYDRHLKRLRAIYGERRAALMKAFEKHLGSNVEVFGDSAGSHVLVRLRTKLTTKQIVSEAQKQGIGLQPSAAYYQGSAPEREFLIGYGGLTPRQLDAAVAGIAGILG